MLSLVYHPAPVGSPSAPLPRVPSTTETWLWLLGSILSTLISRMPSVVLILLFLFFAWVLTTVRKESR